MKQKIVLLDIDRTIIDTDRLKEEVRVGQTGKLVFSKKNLKKYMYGDVEQAVLQLSKIAVIGIFSQGIDEFQRAKLSTIEHLFKKEHVYIDLEKIPLLPNVIEKYKDRIIIIVDDSSEVLKTAKKINPSVFTIVIKRNGKDSRRDRVVFTPDFVVQSMKEVVTMVKKIDEKA